MNHCNIGTHLKINGLLKYKVVRTVKLDLHIHLLFQVCRIVDITKCMLE